MVHTEEQTELPGAQLGLENSRSSKPSPRIWLTVRLSVCLSLQKLHIFFPTAFPMRDKQPCSLLGNWLGFVTMGCGWLTELALLKRKLPLCSVVIGLALFWGHRTCCWLKTVLLEMSPFGPKWYQEEECVWLHSHSMPHGLQLGLPIIDIPEVGRGLVWG